MLDISNVYTKMKEKCKSAVGGEDERKRTKESSLDTSYESIGLRFNRSNLFLRLSARDAVPLIM